MVSVLRLVERSGERLNSVVSTHNTHASPNGTERLYAKGRVRERRREVDLGGPEFTRFSLDVPSSRDRDENIATIPSMKL